MCDCIVQLRRIRRRRLQRRALTPRSARRSQLAMPRRRQQPSEHVSGVSNKVGMLWHIELHARSQPVDFIAHGDDLLL